MRSRANSVLFRALVLFALVMLILGAGTYHTLKSDFEQVTIRAVADYRFVLGNILSQHRQQEEINIEDIRTEVESQGYRLYSSQSSEYQDFLDHSMFLERYAIVRSNNITLFRTSDTLFLWVRWGNRSFILTPTRQKLAEYSHTRTTLTMVGLMGVLLSILLIMIIRMLSPLKKIQHAMIRFGGGDIEARAQIAGKDEIADLAASFNQMADLVESSMKQREQLMRNVAHELRTPITKGRLALEMLPESRHRQMIAKSYERLESLVQMLMDREGYQWKSEPPKTLDILAVVEEVCQLLDQDQQLCRLYGKGPIKVWISPTGAYSLIKNVLENAIKYRDTADPVDIYAQEQILEICNTGDPFEEAFEHYMEPFVRGDMARTQHAQAGFGLGLSIVRQISQVFAIGIRYEYRKSARQHVFRLDFPPVPAEYRYAEPVDADSATQSQK